MSAQQTLALIKRNFNESSIASLIEGKMIKVNLNPDFASDTYTYLTIKVDENNIDNLYVKFECVYRNYKATTVFLNRLFHDLGAVIPLHYTFDKRQSYTTYNVESHCHYTQLG